MTKFLGLPVDGPKSEMINNLKAKGFKSSLIRDDVLQGRFNGNNVDIHVVTEKGKVFRVMVCDANQISETEIKIRFNQLCRQFRDNGKYVSFDDYTIPEDEDISYEMAAHNKRYEAAFYQLPDGESKEKLQASIISELRSKYTPEQLASPTDEISADIFFACLGGMVDVLKNKSVWFMISEIYGKYYITMFYDNELNRANGEDL